MTTEPGTATARGRRAWSLRRRLVVGIVALLAAVSLVVGVLSVAALRQNLLARLDEQVADAAGRAAGPPKPAANEGTWDSTPENRIGTLVVRAHDGRVVRADYTADDGSTRTLDAAQVETLLGLGLREGEFATVDLGALGEFRVAARGRPPGDAVLAGLPTTEVSATVGNLALIFGLLALAAVAVTALAGTQVVRIALRPLGRVTATARRVAALPLDRGEVALADRVPDADPATEVGQVGAAINRMLEHVESSLRARQESEEKVRQFVADASHELRTPLASIRGYSELTRRTGRELPDDIVFALARIEAESIRMTSLVEDLLLLARLDAARDGATRASGIAAAPVDLVPLLADAVADAHAASADHRWELETTADDVVVSGDADRLRQVLANLLGNARIHTPAGTRVTAALATDGADAVVTLADDGPGIPEALLPDVFERFARGDASRSRGTGSTGLGLAIAAAVVEVHGGTIAVTSAPGATRFVVRLPLRVGGENMERPTTRP